MDESGQEARRSPGRAERIHKGSDEGVNGVCGRCSLRRAMAPVKVQREGENYVRGRNNRWRKEKIR